MEVNIETPDGATGGLNRQMRVRIPADRVAQAVDQRLRNMSQRAKLPGFRPGKAPFKVIQQQYGASARMDAVSDLVQRSYPEALMQVGARPAGQPRIDITAEQPGEPLEYVANFEVYPEIQLNGLDALEIDQPVVEVTEADVDRLVQNLRKARRTLEAVTRPAQVGDVIKVDVDGKIDGESFEGSTGQDLEVELGLGQFQKDMEDGIPGHAAGETFELPVTFPEDYRSESLRGKTAQFTLTLKQVQEPQLPAAEDPEFLKAHNVETVDELLQKAREALDNERRKAIQRMQKDRVMAQLAEKNPIDVPTGLIEKEIPSLRSQAAARLNLQGADPDKLAEMLPAQVFAESAKRKVMLGLLVGEVIKTRSIKLDNERVERALDALAHDYEQPEQVKAYYRQRQELMDGLRAVTLEDQVVEELLAGARRNEKPMSLDELLNPKAQA